jgi:4-hydroxy-L-threonine phosphate dehydrogenase PdxA
MRPVIALAMGDPAGISPELTAKLLALDEVVDKARIVVIGDRRVLDDGARVAAVKLDLVSASPDPTSQGKSGRRFSSISATSIRHRLCAAPQRPRAAGLRWPIIAVR